MTCTPSPIYTITNIPPAIHARSTSNLFYVEVEKYNIYINEITKLAERKYRNQPKNMARFRELVKRYMEVYERKKAEEDALYEKIKEKKKQEPLSFAKKNTCIFRKYGPQQESGVIGL